MKPTIQVIPNDENNGYIVFMEKELGRDNYDMFAKQKEIRKFKTTERQVFIEAIDMAIREILNQFGIIPFDITESALESAFDTLKRKYGKTIEIIDRYKYTKEIVVDRKDLITIILEKGILSCANEIRVVDYER